MISRKTTVIIQQLYEEVFCNDPILYEPLLDKDKLYYFLYEDNHEGWFLDILRRRINTAPDLRNFVLDLHTGLAYTSRTKNTEEKRETGQSLLKHLAVSILKFVKPDLGATPTAEKSDVLARALFNRLTLDGYLYKNGQLFPLESSVVDEQEEQSVLEQLIDRLGLPESDLIKHHIDLSEQAYLESRWNDTISNARNFLEATLHQVAGALHLKLHGTNLSTNRPVEIRDYLRTAALIDETEKLAIAKIYSLISNTGSHPNIAAEDQARLMRNLALTFSQYILLQWEGYLTNNP